MMSKGIPVKFIPMEKRGWIFVDQLKHRRRHQCTSEPPILQKRRSIDNFADPAQVMQSNGAERVKLIRRNFVFIWRTRLEDGGTVLQSLLEDLTAGTVGELGLHILISMADEGQTGDHIQLKAPASSPDTIEHFPERWRLVD
jgi:hypothetical protein